MGAPRKYSIELMERATRMAVDARRDPETARGAIARVAQQLGVHPEALRNWVRQAEIDAGGRAGTTSVDAARIKELEREVGELRRANKILRQASAYFAQVELDRPWTPDYAITFGMGPDEIVQSIMVQVHGNGPVVGFIDALLTRLGRRAYDCSAGGDLHIGGFGREHPCLDGVPRPGHRGAVTAPQPAG